MPSARQTNRSSKAVIGEGHGGEQRALDAMHRRIAIRHLSNIVGQDTIGIGDNRRSLAGDSASA
jgi:hypothetical protein